MSKPFVQILAFTSKLSGRARELINDIEISEAFDPQVGGDFPPMTTYKGVWDTGATNTVISQKVVNDLSLQPSGKVTAYAVGSAGQVNQYEADTYLVNIYLPNRIAIPGLRVSVGSFGDEDILIGMDLITLGDFAISNFNGKTTWNFRYPSAGEIDWVKEHNFSNILAAKNAKNLAKSQARLAQKIRNKK